MSTHKRYTGELHVRRATLQSHIQTHATYLEERDVSITDWVGELKKEFQTLYGCRRTNRPHSNLKDANTNRIADKMSVLADLQTCRLVCTELCKCPLPLIAPFYVRPCNKQTDPHLCNAHSFSLNVQSFSLDKSLVFLRFISLDMPDSRTPTFESL